MKQPPNNNKKTSWQQIALNSLRWTGWLDQMMVCCTSPYEEEEEDYNYNYNDEDDGIRYERPATSQQSKRPVLILASSEHTKSTVPDLSISFSSSTVYDDDDDDDEKLIQEALTAVRKEEMVTRLSRLSKTQGYEC
jgi:hypothetical protein